MSREAVSITDAAKILDVSRWTIARLVQAGQLPAFRVGGCKRIALADLQQFKRANLIVVARSGM